MKHLRIIIHTVEDDPDTPVMAAYRTVSTLQLTAGVLGIQAGLKLAAGDAIDKFVTDLIMLGKFGDEPPTFERDI